ncbi:14946_t:CDS:2 [Acaulospora morrowiae]|uniref:14946_t:CDS:1 n=1 Tax=Acaulospora morrowiae TaxID=94023 RepID=A0A9N9BD25_9GLOM|nr:14946_t:CDS:2 [Acaulospora morrowiae]
MSTTNLYDKIYDFLNELRSIIDRVIASVKNLYERSSPQYIRLLEVFPEKPSHDNAWKKSDNKLVVIAEKILNALNDAWKNHSFRPDFLESLNEGTYTSNVILPAIRATLQDLPLGQSSFISSFEKQSNASADRKGGDFQGR